MTTQSGGPASTPENKSSRAWIGWLIALLVAVGFGLWLVNSRDAEPAASPSPSETPLPSVTPSITPSPSPSPSVTPSPTAAAAQFSDVDGVWCQPDAGEDTPCAYVELPSWTFEASEVTNYVFPPGVDAPLDPDTFDYDFAAEDGGCWVADTDTLEGQSGAAFIYCPVGAEPGGGADWVRPWDTAVERLYMSQGDPGAPPYLRSGD